MRLTLRTLLAYLDDVLEPAQAKEIGEKIAESPMARDLEARLREILRRRRVTAPQVSGPGSGPDPNLTAEYLDNTLSPAGVAEFERMCLESDVHLAEVAGCHQILTLVLGEAVDVPAELRERMYALGPAPIPPQPDADGEPRREDAQPAAEAAPPQPAAAATRGAFEAGLPQQLRRKSAGSRLLPIAIALIGVGWLALIVFDPSFRGSGVDQNLDDAVAAVEGDEATLVEDSVDAAAPEADEAAQPEERDPGDAGLEEEDADVEAEADESTEPAVPDAGESDTDGVVESPPEPPPVPPAPVAVGEEQPDAADEDAIQRQPVEAVSMLYNSPEGILLGHDDDTGDWMVLPRRSLVHPGDELATPEPFTARLQIDRGDSLALMLGGTRVQVLGVNPVGEFGFAIHRGRMGVFRLDSEPDEEQNDAVRFGIGVGRVLYQVELAEPDTWCGFEVLPRQPHGRDEPPQPRMIDGGIFVARGTVKLTMPDGSEAVLTAENGWRPWHVGEEAPPQPLLAVPNWLSPDGPALTAVERTYANQYENMFPLDLPVWQSIPAVVRSPRPRLSQFAVETLAVTENYRELVRALKSVHEEARLAAIRGLREWLPRDPEHADQLNEALSRIFHDDDARTVEALLWGYDVADGRDPQTSARLVGWLGSDEVAVRELALFHIEALTGRDYDYHPTAPPAQRQAAIVRWREHLDRNGALLPGEGA